MHRTNLTHPSAKKLIKKTKIKFLCKGITIKNMLKNNEINTLIKLIAGVLKEASVLEEIRISLYVIGVSNPEPK